MSSSSQPADPHDDQVAAAEQHKTGVQAKGASESAEKSLDLQERSLESSGKQQDAPSSTAGQAAPKKEDKIDTAKDLVEEDDTTTASEAAADTAESSVDIGGKDIEARPAPQSLNLRGTEGAMVPEKDGVERSSTPPPVLPLKKEQVSSPSPPPPPPKDEKYLASAQDVPLRIKTPVSQAQSTSGRKSEDADAAEYSEKYIGSQDGVDDSKSEIQSIMEQFDDENAAVGMEEIMSPRLEFAGSVLESPVSHPPRRSSLEPLTAASIASPSDESAHAHRALGSPPPRTSSLYRVSTGGGKEKAVSIHEHPSSPALHKPPPPAPDPEPDLPFDFHRFLEQLRHRTADPVAKFLRSFLLEFGKKQWMVHEQVKIISDFLEFISKKMAQCEVWRTVSDAEFDNAREGMEKLVMNRLYSQTFSPAIAPPEPIAASRSKRRGTQETASQGRRGQHQEDVERDEVLAQKVRIYKWVNEEHLDISPVGEKGRKFLVLAQQG